MFIADLLTAFIFYHHNHAAFLFSGQSRTLGKLDMVCP